MISFIFREAFRAIRRTPGTWAMQVLALAVALGVSGFFASLAWNAHSAMRSIRANLAIEAFFDPSISSSEATRITERDLKGLPGVQSVAFISREQALADYSKMSGENVEAVLGMNPLPASATIRLADPTADRARDLVEKIRGVEGIADVRSDLPLVAAMERRAKALDTVAVVAGALLMLSALLFTLLTARFVARTRAEAIHTMSLLGATKRLILTPMIIESAFAGLIGGVLASVILILLERNAFSAFGEELRLSSSSREQYLIAICLVVTGVVLGMVGSLTRRGINRSRY